MSLKHVILLKEIAMNFFFTILTYKYISIVQRVIRELTKITWNKEKKYHNKWLLIKTIVKAYFNSEVLGSTCSFVLSIKDRPNIRLVNFSTQIVHYPLQGLYIYTLKYNTNHCLHFVRHSKKKKIFFNENKK